MTDPKRKTFLKSKRERESFKKLNWYCTPGTPDPDWGDDGSPPYDVVVVEFAAKITAAWQEALANIIKTGRLLIQARDELGYGNFGSLFDSEEGSLPDLLPFSWRTANKLMRIARHPVLSDSTHESNLPARLETLHILSRISEYRLKELIRQKKVHSDLKREEAEHLVSKRPNRIAAAIEVLFDAMRKHHLVEHHLIEALVADLREVVDDERDDEDDNWGSRLDGLSTWIAELNEVWKQADEEAKLEEAKWQAQDEREKLNGEEQRPDA
jgi:hypothetical protein